MNPNTLSVLHRAYMQPFSIQPNYARANAYHVAELASRGLITTQIWISEFGKHWRVSPAGLAVLNLTTMGES